MTRKVRPMQPLERSTNRSDNELIAAIKEGDDRATQQLIERYYKRVVHTCYRFLSCPEDAHDVTQDVFGKLMAEDKLQLFKGKSQFWTWLYRITRNTCYTFLKKKDPTKSWQPIEWVTESNEGFDCLISEDTPEKTYIQEQRITVMTTLLEQLPLNYQKVIYLIYHKGYSYAEAAKKLNKSSQVIGVHLMRGKHMLQKLHEQWWGDYQIN